MIQTLSPALAADLLIVVVVGPSLGESIGVRVPPDRWLLVDSLSARPRDGRSIDEGLTPLADLLEDLGANADLIALTHPHLDHCLGLERLVERFAAGEVGCVGIWPDAIDTRMRDAARKQGEHLRNVALAAIKSRWEDDRQSEWRLRAGATRRIGDEAHVEVLFPDDEALREQQDRDLFEGVNETSSPMLVTWRGARVVLGADLTAKPGWERVTAIYSDLNDHAVLKVAHHASREAQHGGLLMPDPGRRRLWVSTPWQLAGRRLPNIAPCEETEHNDECHGPARLLRYNDELFLTAHGQKLTASLPRQRLSREDLAAISAGGPTPNETRPVPPAPAPAARDAWVAVAINSEGEIADVQMGSAAVVLTPP